jgi:hypothetical protein
VAINNDLSHLFLCSGEKFVKCGALEMFIFSDRSQYVTVEGKKAGMRGIPIEVWREQGDEYFMNTFERVDVCVPW